MGRSGDGIPEKIAARTAVAGGTAFVLSGGKFANGTITGAFAQMYNAEDYAAKYWNEVLICIQKFGQTVASTVQNTYRALIPGYALAECAAGCRSGELALAAARAFPALKYPVSGGNMVVRGIMTSVGEITVTGVASTRGSTLVIDDQLVWAADGTSYANSLGTAQIMRASRPLFDEARSYGFNEVTVNAFRISGANPNRSLSITIDLKR